MASASQIEANRANAQLSTGPKTQDGINSTKFNATKHGLTGKQIVVRGENPADYDALRAQLIAEHAPESEIEAMLIEELAQNFWRLERARRCESQMLDKLDLAAAMSDRAFLNLQRYTSRIERSFARAKKDLAALQALRQKRTAKAGRADLANSFAAYLAERRSPHIGSVLSPAAKPPATAQPAPAKEAA
jgi:hypothetical protein